MTRGEIERNIKREERRIERLKERMSDICFDIEATRKSIRFWKGELGKLK